VPRHPAVLCSGMPCSDHKYNTYYFRVANSPQWKRIALDQVQWKKMDGCVRYMKVSSC